MSETKEHCRKCDTYMMGAGYDPLCDDCVNGGCSPVPCSQWLPLFEHMERQYGVTLTDGEMGDIAMIVDKTRMNKNGVAMILVNCLRHLSTEEMIKLGKDIGERCGYSFQENDKAIPPN